MKVSSENEHLAQMNTMKDFNSHICFHHNLLLADDSCGKNRKVGENIERSELRTEWPGPAVPCLDAIEMNGQKCMPMHVGKHPCIFTWREIKKKKSDVTRLPAQAANSSGTSKTASSDHFQWKWWQSEHREPVCCSLANLWTFIESAGCCEHSLQRWIRFRGKREAYICVCIIAWLR